ncbi:hypothetical protein HanOQP8_Chr15g0562091 [Helianthus annuus]|nr:hypothetical protein HanOQP8_Chr15g0562091 [Helianthus annuus]
MEENAIAKATKALQTCIAKHHARADSLPSDKKQKNSVISSRERKWDRNPRAAVDFDAAIATGGLLKTK